MLIVKGEKIAEPQSAGLHLFKEGPGSVPLVAPWRIDSVKEHQNPYPEGWRCQHQKSDQRTSENCFLRRLRHRLILLWPSGFKTAVGSSNGTLRPTHLRKEVPSPSLGHG